MHVLPSPQSDDATHCAFASLAVRHTRSLAHEPMRLSMVLQYASPCAAVHVYLQKPPTHFFGVVPPPHCVSSVQFGFGRVSTTQAPWSQNFPPPHSASPAHACAQTPDTHCGVAPPHCCAVVQAGPPGAGSHAPLAHVKPAAQGVASQLDRHCPSAQIFPASHSLENLQVFAAAVHAPETHA